ncbi:aromatic ring-hydroxylating dioxygenase subunit alpha [Hydrogenophaga sp. 2FB]|uniref:aromatic ring-hydroxylating oxygenase subunit alpha n=1 Tax=Hydrogenophaga sp. 2FB TaxID=2502187 RepID=UPI0010F520AE|nr:aromatic ring-hydroxylating dioxygenase subunit alpha [Hydrogenophaga sp. 2FB]
MSKPLIEDRSFLRHFWHPVCTREELEQANPSGRGPLAVTLLGEKLVVANLAGKIAVMQDRCAHRSAALSRGAVEGDQLRCNYHGWRYDASGRTVHIPACPEQPIPRKARSPAYECEMRYDLVWVRLDSSWQCTEIPYFSEWDKPEMRNVVVPSYVWNTAPERRWENFTDLSHFAFVHPGTLYDPGFDRPPVPSVDRVDGEMRFAIEPPPEMQDKLPENSPLGSFTYRCSMPYSINLVISLYRDGTTFTLWTTASPIDESHCRNFLIVSRAQKDDDPDNAHLAFQKQVLLEDQPIIESQTPAEITMDEVSLVTDKVSNQYRKWMRELSLAALDGKDAFVKALQTNAIDKRLVQSPAMTLGATETTT